MSEIQIVDVTPDRTDVLTKIVSIANRAALPRRWSTLKIDRWSDHGFLISGHSMEKYMVMAASHRFFSAATWLGHTVAFLVGYRAGMKVDDDDFSAMYIRKTHDHEAAIISQIATDPMHRKQGFAAALYRYFEEAVRKDVYVDIVNAPPNRSSAAFHAEMGFREIATFEHPDGTLRGIWRKKGGI